MGHTTRREGNNRRSSIEPSTARRHSLRRKITKLTTAKQLKENARGAKTRNRTKTIALPKSSLSVSFPVASFLEGDYKLLGGEQ